MSAISDFHTVELYTGKNKPSDDTQRISVITFKTEKRKGAKELDGKPNPEFDPTYKRPEARCISIPKLKIHTTPSELQDAMQEAFNDLQDALIRRLLLVKLDAAETIINFHNDQIGFTAVAAYAAEVTASGKLTKDAIIEWFDTDLADSLTLAIAEAMKIGEKPTPEDERKLAAAVTGYRTIFTALAAPRAGLSKNIASQLQRAMVRASNPEDQVFLRLDAKLKDSLEEKDPELIGL